MIATAFRPVEVGPDLAAILNLLALLYIYFVAMYFIWRIIFGGRNSNAKKSEEQLSRLHREWFENGIAITNWLRINLPVSSSIEATISNREFQELLRKDFEIYNKLVVLDPRLKEDTIFNEGRCFYKSLIRT